MNQRAATTPFKIEDVTQRELEDALDAVLVELIAYRLRPRVPGPPDPMQLIHFSKLLDQPIRSRRALGRNRQ